MAMVLIRAGEWECYHSTRKDAEDHSMPSIICRPKGSIKDVSYFEFFGNKALLHKPKNMNQIPQEEYDRILFSKKWQKQ